MVVDDERVVLHSCRAILSEHDYEIETVLSGEEGLHLVESRSFDVALIDLKMPGMPGMELIGRIKELRPEIVNVVITGFATVETAVEAMKKGAFDYVCKPFTPEELEVVVQKALETKRLHEAIAKAEEEKERFVLTIYHQLKSPVGIIQGYVENLLKGVPGEEQERTAILDRCLKRAGALRQLLEDLLSLSRLQSEKLEQQAESVNLDALLRELVEGWQARAHEKDLALELLVDPELPSITADRKQIEHLFMNLIDNAFKYNRQDGTVRVRATPNQEGIRVEISDTGLGVPEDDIPNIFDEFYRCRSDETRMTPGTGLGLPIVKRIVETHGGRIKVESELGKGTTVRVWLPFHQMKGESRDG